MIEAATGDVLEKRSSKNFRKIHTKTHAPEACNFVKKETPAQVFSFEFAKFLRIPFSGKCFRKDQGENGK